MMPAPRALGNVLVTGAGGFVGTALVARLRAAGLAVVTSDLGGGDLPCDLADMRQTDALLRKARFDTVFHCGAVSGPMVMADRPLDIWQINATGTAILLETARTHGAGRIVLCSTTEVYGPRPEPVDEATLPCPASVYAASKVAAEQAMLGYAAEHGLDAVALRLSWIYGPGRRTPTMLEAMLRAALRSDTATFDAHPDDITHYLHVEDAVEGLVRAAQAARPPERIYNITAGEGLPLYKIVGAITRLRPAARIALTGAPGREIVPAAIDNRRALVDLGFRPVLTPEAGLDRWLTALQHEDDTAKGGMST